MLQQDVHDLATALQMLGESQSSMQQLLVSLADAGAIVSVRDSSGVMLWATSNVSGGLARALGHRVPEGARYWHPDGREMAADERPVDRARMTGRAEDGSIYGVQLPDETTTRWNQVLVLPLARGSSGRHAVLTIGFDITAAINAIQLAELVGLASREAALEVAA